MRSWCISSMLKCVNSGRADVWNNMCGSSKGLLYFERSCWNRSSAKCSLSKYDFKLIGFNTALLIHFSNESHLTDKCLKLLCIPDYKTHDLLLISPSSYYFCRTSKTSLPPHLLHWVQHAGWRNRWHCYSYMCKAAGTTTSKKKFHFFV